MAHGSPLLCLCESCKQYIHVGRFEKEPLCPTCNNKARQTTKQELRELGMGLFDFVFSFNNWTKLK